MARRIEIVKPFNYEWSRMASTHFSEIGKFLVKDEVADFAIARGYAVEAPEESKTPPRKRATRRRGAASNPRGTAGVDPADFPDTRRAPVRRSVDHDAGQR